MTLHRPVREWLETLTDAAPPEDGSEGGSGDPYGDGFDVAAYREAVSLGSEPATGEDLLLSEVHDVDAGGVPARLYVGRLGAPAVVHLHGGAWVAGGLDTHDVVCRRIARVGGLSVLAVDYRLAPEHPFPAPLDDARAALAWVREHGQSHGVDGSRVAVLGDSAGGALAAALALDARDAGHPLDAQVLVYPALDATTSTLSYDVEDGPGLEAAAMRASWAAYAPDPATHAEPLVSPSAATDLAGLPPTYVLTAEHDVLRDEAEEYAARLAEAGVPVVAVRALGIVHGFWRRPAQFPASAAALGAIATWLREQLGAD